MIKRKPTSLNKVRLLKTIKSLGINDSSFTLDTIEKGQHYRLTFKATIKKHVIDYVMLRLGYTYSPELFSNYFGLTGQGFKDTVIDVKKAEKPILGA